jgi:sortase A
MSVRRGAMRWLERTCLAVGVGCLSWLGLEQIEAASFRRYLESTSSEVRKTDAPSARPALVGRLEIPRLGIADLIAEGDDDRTLGAAIGHLPDTPLPWEPGNSALAGHRDSVFRPLRDVRIGDRLRIVTTRGALEYRVTETLIVEPEDTWVLAPTPERTLTLVTCYPFTYIGSAPQRFVVRAVMETSSREGHARHETN